MRKFIDVISEGFSPNHNRIEIIFSESAELILDSFKNPDKEFKIVYKVVYEDADESILYMEATVIENLSNKPVIKVDYKLGDKNLTVSNIISFRDDKNMYTSNGLQSGAADMSFIAMRWLFKNILLDANSRGYDAVKITSSTRFSGARAKNGQKTSIYDIPINYNVNQRITERFVYTLQDGIIFLDQ